MALARRTRSKSRNASAELAEFNLVELGVAPIQWPAKETASAAKRARKDEDPMMRFSSITPPTTDTTTFPFVELDKNPAAGEEEDERLLRGRTAGDEEVSFLARNRRVVARAPSGENFFDTCSDDLVVKMLSFTPERHLGTIARVCHRFARLMLDLSLWPAMEIRDRLLTSPALLTALQCNPHSFRAISCNIRSIPTLPRLFSLTQIPRLTHLSLAYSVIDDHEVIFLIKLMPHIVVADFSGMALSDACLRTLAATCPRLEDLSLRMARDITDDGVCAVLASCPRLRLLNLSWTDVGSRALTMLALTAPILEQLDLSGLGESLHDTDVDDILSCHTHLQTVDLSDCYNLTDLSLDSMLAHCPSLARVAMSRCHNITMAALMRLLSKPSLVSVNMFGCINDVRQVILRSFPLVEFNRVALSQVGSVFESGAAPDGLTDFQRRQRGL